VGCIPQAWPAHIQGAKRIPSSANDAKNSHLGAKSTATPASDVSYLPLTFDNPFHFFLKKKKKMPVVFPQKLPTRIKMEFTLYGFLRRATERNAVLQAQALTSN
jgi:hypothetical protein